MYKNKGVRLNDSRFEFGKNWSKYIENLTENKIQEAEAYLCEMLHLDCLKDVGCGSGIFSLAARNLGASVHSFDYDINSVECTKRLKDKYYTDDHNWIIEQGSVLDKEYMRSLGKFDVIYSWGVLHHTGDMNSALKNVVLPVKKGSSLFIAIYNDQNYKSVLWNKIKQIYNKTPENLRFLILLPCLIILWGPITIRDFIKLKPFTTWNNYNSYRGMDPWTDLIDWVGGYPFEVAYPEEIFRFYFEKGFKLTNLKTCAGGLGCNQFVFIKE